MLDKLEQIIGLMAKTGSITVKRIDENDNVIYQKTDADLKFGSYKQHRKRYGLGRII